MIHRPTRIEKVKVTQRSLGSKVSVETDGYGTNNGGDCISLPSSIANAVGNVTYRCDCAQRSLNSTKAVFSRVSLRECRRVCDFPVQFATRLPDWSADGLLQCPCVVSCSKFHGPDAHDLLQTSSRGCYEENAPVKFQLD